ncbi:ABC transporter ATP-binding protein [Mucilaginibacter robiniae]|uniref:ABC transporter ATP-binding protein n=1 Tax=Mucilaginibacter robiniae TaxID=2728022 RepID=A0A7L5E0K4_9SPHI|nr:ABC transporter ATP-binding protein [Mucilaginibacter robiniae]QJD96902.1 ABC transporter ATP-binding protein [Mucilaginibacter robiniae]
MPSSNSFLQVKAVSKIYPGAQQSGVKKAYLNVQAGKITAIIGQSGSGKSTLLRLLYGLLSPDEGQVLFKGERIWGPEEKLIPGHDAMKMVTQHTDDLNPYAKVWDNVAVLLPNTNIKGKQEKTEQVLRQLNMFHLANKRVADLSGGEKQRVAIARALVTQPEVLLLDEPFNQVDTTFRDGLQQDIRHIVKQTGLTVIIVSHDPAEVLSMADELVVLKDGEILEAGMPKVLYQKPQNLYTARLLTSCNVLHREEARVLGIKAQKEQIVIYPEWAEPSSSGQNIDWAVKEILFKGAYEDVHLEYGPVELHVYNYDPGKYDHYSHVHVNVRQYLEFD